MARKLEIDGGTVKCPVFIEGALDRGIDIDPDVDVTLVCHKCTCFAGEKDNDYMYCNFSLERDEVILFDEDDDGGAVKCPSCNSLVSFYDNCASCDSAGIHLEYYGNLAVVCSGKKENERNKRPKKFTFLDIIDKESECPGLDRSLQPRYVCKSRCKLFKGFDDGCTQFACGYDHEYHRILAVTDHTVACPEFGRSDGSKCIDDCRYCVSSFYVKWSDIGQVEYIVCAHPSIHEENKPARKEEPHEAKKPKEVKEVKGVQDVVMKKGNMEAALDRVFNMVGKKVDNVVWDLSTMELGILDNEDGVYTLGKQVDEEGNVTFEYTLNPLDMFSMSVPAFAIRTPLDQVTIGDLIVVNSKTMGFVVDIDVEKDRVKVLRKTGTIGWVTPPKVQFLQNKGVLVVKNILNAGDNQMLATLLMMGDDFGGDTMGKLVALSMFSGNGGLFNMGGGDNPFGNLMPLMLMKDGFNGDPGSMMKMIMLSTMMGANQGVGNMNPLMMAIMMKGL